MNWQEIASDAINLVKTAGLKKDVIDLLKEKIALLTEEIVNLRSENASLGMKCANLEQKIADLEQELERLRPTQQRLNTTQENFLKILFRETECPLSYIAAELRTQYEMAAHHKDVLSELEMIRWTGGATGDFGEGEPTYELTSKGRTYLVNGGLV
jgi:uncharacterized small protein (DUF1192 family)